MARTVFCEHLKQDAEGLDYQLYPGDIGTRIYKGISKQAWAEWQKKQVMLINEHKLSMLKAEDRQLLEDAMIGFLFEGKEVTVEGYVPKA